VELLLELHAKELLLLARQLEIMVALLLELPLVLMFSLVQAVVLLLVSYLVVKVSQEQLELV
jgi:hypothetical protein